MKNLNIIQHYYNIKTTKEHCIKMVDGYYLAIIREIEEPFTIENLRFEIMSTVKQVISHIANCIKNENKKYNDSLIIKSDDNILLDKSAIMEIYNKGIEDSSFIRNTIKDLDELISRCKK